MLEFTLTQPPSTNKLRRAFCVNGRVKQVKTPEYNAWIATAKKELLAYNWQNMPPPPYNIVILVGKCNKMRDLDNFAKAVLDLLVNAEIIEDDNISIVLELTLISDFTGVEEKMLKVRICNIPY